MKPIKQQWIDQPYEKCNTLQTNRSAFRPYKQEQMQQSQVDMSFDVNDIETYINKRKFQNSFTLSDITVSSFASKKQHVKIQSSNETQETVEAEMPLMKTQFCRPPFIISQVVQFSYVPKVKPLKSKRMFSHQISVKHLPVQKQLKNYGIQTQVINQQQIFKKKMQIQQSFTEDESQIQREQKVDYQKKSKKEKKQQKISQKKIKRPRKIKQKPQEDDSNRSGKRERKEIKMLDQKMSSKQQLTTEFPFEGVLRNCQCCGKLISKLCFKCPHLYCKAQNCPRKRKKILNQKMLEKMKEQKIKQHYRQRELYEKMKLQQGGAFNPKLNESSKAQKHQQNNRNKIKISNQNKNPTRKRKQNQFRIYSNESNEWKTSQEQLQSEIFYDSEEQEQKSKPHQKIHQKSSKSQQKNDRKREIQQEVIKKEVRQSNKNYFNNVKQIYKNTSKKTQNKFYEQKIQRTNGLSMIDSFSQSLLMQNNKSNEDSFLNIKQKKKSKQIQNQQKTQQTKKDSTIFNNYNQRDKKVDFYFDSDFESTF